MELAKIKDEFRDYLTNLNNDVNESSAIEEVSGVEDAAITEENNNYNTDDENVSLFTYSDELSDFLNQNYKDEIDNAYVKTEDVLNLEFEDGHFIQNDKAEGSEKREEIPVVDILNDVLQDEKVREKVDLNNDGELTKEEAGSFVNAINDLDDKKDDIKIF